MAHDMGLIYVDTPYQMIYLSKNSFLARFLPNKVAKTKYFLVFVSSIISAKQEFEFWIESRNHSDKY